MAVHSHIFVNPVSINIVFTVSVSLRTADVCPSKRLGHKLKWCRHGQTRIILCSISTAAWEPKSLHKLHCYLGQTSVSKHVADLEPQPPTLSAVFVLYVCAGVTAHTCTNKGSVVMTCAINVCSYYGEVTWRHREKRKADMFFIFCD